MIVNLTKSGWEIIYHRAHALLAAQIAGHWMKAKIPMRFYETVAAISHHDDLEREWEGDRITETGAPRDFMLGESTSVAKLQEQIDSAVYRGRWVALLTSKHLTFLTEAQRGESKEIDAFLDTQLKQQKQWQKELGVSSDVTEASYNFMRWCDRLSLILCQRKIPDAGRALEITKGPDGKRYDMRQVSEGLLTVEPWAFEDDKFTVGIDACQLAQMTFKNSEELIQALQNAPLKTLEWTFIKQS